MASQDLAPQKISAEIVRQQVLGDVVHNCSISRDCVQHLSLVVIGEAGQGKSTLVNGLVGSQVAMEGHSLKAGTMQLERFNFKQNDVEVEIWDTPGFGMVDQKEEEQMFRKMVQHVEQVDLMLYCIRIDRKRWPERHDKETIIQITDIFTKKVWSHCLFVLTFANCVVEQLRPEPDEDDLGPAFSRHCTMWEEEIRVQLHKLVGMNEDELQNVRTVPAGSYSCKKKGENPWKLPDREDWFIFFWIDCTYKIREAAQLTLLQLNKHRLIDDMPPAKAGLGNTDQNSIDPGMIEVHVREIPAWALGDKPGNNPQLGTTSDRTQTCTTNGNRCMQTTDGNIPCMWTASRDQNIYDEKDQNIIDSSSTEKSVVAGMRLKAQDSDMSESLRPEHRMLPTHHIMEQHEKEVSTYFKKLSSILCHGCQRRKE